MEALWGAIGLIVLAFMTWIGKKAFKGEYEKGRQDEQKDSNKKVKDLASKLYTNPDSHFSVRMPGLWRKTTKTRATVRLESDTASSTDK
jgi:2-methylcitrate dehydratase PrpD